ncbi:MAG: lipid-A-disaccharide synthase, partial [Myxococcota bacterium]|nr:lipid-A-disaccharide synthase [Myxococcota bacterium]
LELAIMGVPQVVAHRVSPVTYQLGRRLVRGVRHISLPNILAEREVIPEFVQHLDPDVLCRALLGLPDRQEVDLSALGESGGAGRAAELVLECLS